MNCTQCSMPLAAGARFCSNCGLTVQAPPVQPPGYVGTPYSPAVPPTPNLAKSMRNIMVAMGLVAVLGVVPFVFMFQGCSSTEGSFASKGQPLGDFVLSPKECKSGQHEGFYGVFLLPEQENQGGIKIVKDAVKNAWVIHVEIPGSCSPTCKVVTLDASRCATYDIAVERTNTTVNDIRLLDGRLNLACSFEGGSTSANVKFEGCD